MSSPGWKKPCGLVRRKSRRSSTANDHAAAKENTISTQSPAAPASPRSNTAKKRRNPFGNARASPKKKPKSLIDVKKENEVSHDGIELFDALENVDSEKVTAD